MSLVEEAIKIWETFRAGVLAEVENAPEEHLEYRIGEGARTFREIAFHIAEAGVGTRSGTQSRLTALYFAIAHEMYHRGQLASYARGFGAVPALTQQLNAMQSTPGGKT
jgi:uncharacterized damage-inducible protein DinB